MEFELFNRWDLVTINIILFSLFLFSLSFKGKGEKLSGGLYLSFITSLFAEMYGFPLTIYLLSSYFGGAPPTYWKGHLLGIPGFILGSAILATGIYLIIAGWRKIYTARGRLVVEGIYSYVRHPQYLGFILLTLGWLIHWPTLITAILWPILTFSYYRLAVEEEKGLLRNFEGEYQEYARKVPMFIPKIRVPNSLRLMYKRHVKRNNLHINF